MARVVQRRKSPPYALIVFVVLFLVAATLAVHQYTEKDTAQKETGKIGQTIKKLVRDDKHELSSQQCQAMIEKYDAKVESGKPGVTVYGQLRNQIKAMTELIIGVESEPIVTLRAADDLYKRIPGDRSGLIPTIKSYQRQLEVQVKETAAAKAERSQATNELDKLKEAQKGQDEQHRESIRKRDVQIKQLQEKFESFSIEKEQVLTVAKQDWEQTRKAKDVKISQQTDQVHAAKAKTREWQKKYKIVLEKLRQKTKRVETAMQPDGKVLRVDDEGKFYYVNLGSKDGVEVGFCFSVFPQTGIPKISEKPEDVQKASLLVVSVGDDVSRCRISSLKKKDNPVVTNDLIVNVAFDSVRKWKFVVEGHFNLHGSDEAASEQGAVEVTLLLRRLGAEVSNTLDIDVDFLVLGKEPLPPKKPEEDSPRAVQEAWAQAVALQKRWSQMKTVARDLRIPILNTNAFLGMTGYTPIKALRDVPPR